MPTDFCPVVYQVEEQRTDAPFALIIEDDPDAGIIFELTLEMAKFTPVVVESGKAALEWLASMMPGIIILDMHLPDVPGMEVLRQMRADPRLAAVPVIVATAHTEMAECVKQEADLVLTKPVRYDVLWCKVAELTRL